MLFSYKYYVTHIPNDDTRYVTANTFIYSHKVQIQKKFDLKISKFRFSTNSSQWERKYGRNIKLAEQN